MSRPAARGAPEAGELSAGAWVVVVVGFVLHLAVGVLVLVSGLIMPAWAVVAMGGVWAAALAFAVHRRRRPLAVMLAPVATFAIWLLAAWAGDTFLDWTA